MAGTRQVESDDRVDEGRPRDVLLHWAAPAPVWQPAPAPASNDDPDAAVAGDPVARAVDSLNLVTASSSLLDSQWDRLDDHERRELVQIVARRARELQAFLKVAVAEVERDGVIDLSAHQ